MAEELKRLAQTMLVYPLTDYPPCVYFLMRRGRIVYVGQTTSLPPRVASHRADKQFDEVRYLPVPRADLPRVEAAFIALLRPEMNRKAERSRLGGQDPAAIIRAACPG